MPAAPMSILFLEKVMPYPPAYTGDVVYSRGLVEAVSEWAQVSVLCADVGATGPKSDLVDWHITGQQRSGRKGSVFSRWPLVAWKGSRADYHRELDRLLTRKWDAIVLDNIGTVHALPKAEAYRRANPRTRLVHVSHEHEQTARGKKYGAYGMNPVLRLATDLDLRKVGRAEERLISSCDLVTVLNEGDAAKYAEVVPRQRYLMLTPGYDGPIAPPRLITAETPRRVVLLGGRRSEQKQQVLLDWLEVGHPTLKAAGIETQLVGDIPEDLRRRIEAAFPDVDVRGYVDDTDEVIAQSRAGLIVDTLGGGFKLRLLTHVFGRLPIIGLEESIEGLPTRSGHGYLGAQTLEGLAQLVVENIDDFDRLNQIKDAAFTACAGNFSWQARAKDLIEALGGEPLSQIKSRKTKAADGKNGGAT